MVNFYVSAFLTQMNDPWSEAFVEHDEVLYHSSLCRLHVEVIKSPSLC